MAEHRHRIRNILREVGFWNSFEEQIQWDDDEDHSDGAVAVAESGEDGDDGNEE